MPEIGLKSLLRTSQESSFERGAKTQRRVFWTMQVVLWQSHRSIPIGGLGLAEKGWPVLREPDPATAR